MASVTIPESLKPVVRYLSSVSTLTWYRGACFTLTLLMLYTLSEWFWQLVPVEGEKPMPKVVATQMDSGGHQGARVDIAHLQTINLFGVAAKDTSEIAPVIQSQPKAVDATPTRLKLKLHGIVQASHPSDALAIIMHQGKDEHYSIGDKLPIGRVVLSQIHQDHVIIENAGRYESIWLFDGQNNESQAASKKVVSKVKSTAGRRDLRNNSQVSGIAKDYRKRLYKNPSSLAEAIRIQPQQKDGVMMGYRISPGRDKAQFDQLGLKANDVVTSINNIDLDDPAKAVEVYKIMRSAREANFVIDRKGEQLELVVSLDDG